MQRGTIDSFENRLPARPRKKWDSIEQYIEFLRHFTAYKHAKTFAEGRSVLEIGCGTGYGSNYLKQFVSDITAIDVSRKCTTYCHIKYKKRELNFIQASGLDIPLKDNSVGAAVSFQVIEHIEPEKVRKYLSEIKRVLKNEGVFIVSTPNKKLRLLPFQKPRNPEHKKEYNYMEFKKTLSNVFENVEVNGLKGSKEIQLIERNRCKQNPFEVYIIMSLYPFGKKMLPDTIFNQLKVLKKSIFRGGKKSSVIQKETFLKFQINDFKVLPYCPKDCLDFYGICKKIEE
jgi:ubiquinone/menaquinone biosynthesis C-methylase UbiE